MIVFQIRQTTLLLPTTMTLYNNNNNNNDKNISAIWFHDTTDYDDVCESVMPNDCDLDSVSDDDDDAHEQPHLFEHHHGVEFGACDCDGGHDDGHCHHEQASEQSWGVCLTCGVALVDENSFVVDRQDPRSDCFTCDNCFVSYFGCDALYNAVNWVVLGKPKPQYTRFEWAC